MRICYLTDFFVPHYYGGGERRYFEIAKRLVKKGHTVHIICMRIKGVPDTEKIKGIVVHHIGPEIIQPPNRTFTDFIRFLHAQLHWLRKKEYDIIEAHGASLFILPFVRFYLKKPAIALIHDISSGTPDQWFALNKLARIYERFATKLPFTKILTVSNGTKHQLITSHNISPERIKVIHNGVDLHLIDSVHVQTTKQKTILFVGRLIPHKHVDDLIIAFSMIQKKNTNTHLTIIGTGISEKELKRQAKTLNLKNVHFLGNISDDKSLIKEIKKSTVVALPSTREGFGIILAEANACNIPVVAYDIEGVRDLLQSGINGILVPPRDISALSKALLELITNQAVRSKLGLQGRSRVEQYFTWDKTTDAIETFYGTLLS